MQSVPGFQSVGTIENAGGRREGSGREKGEVTDREPGTGYHQRNYVF